MKVGNRKVFMFLITFIVTSLFAFLSLLKGVEFTGNDIVMIVTILVACGGWFAGMNVGEWFANALKSKYTKDKE